MGSIHHKFDGHECPIQHAPDRTNSLFDSKTASEALSQRSICRGRSPTNTQTLKLAGVEKPGFGVSREKFQLSLVEDSMNRSIFGILETSTQLS